MKVPVEDNVYVLYRKITKDYSALTFRSMIEQVYGFFPFDEIQISESEYRNHSYYLYRYNGNSRDGIYSPENDVCPTPVSKTNVLQSENSDQTPFNHSNDFSIVFLERNAPQATAYRSNWKSLLQKKMEHPAVLLNQYNWSFSLENATESPDNIKEHVLYSKTGHADSHQISLLQIPELVVSKDTKEIFSEDFIGEPFSDRYEFLWKDELGITTESAQLPLPDDRNGGNIALTVVDRFSRDTATTSFKVTKKDLPVESIRSKDYNMLMLFDKQSLNWKLGALKESEYPELNSVKMFFPQNLRKYEGRGLLRELNDNRSRWNNVISGDVDVRSLVAELTGQPYEFDYQFIVISWGCGDIVFEPLSYMISEYRKHPEGDFSAFIHLLRKTFPDAQICLLLPPSPYVNEFSKIEGFCPWYFLRKARCRYIQMLVQIAKENPNVKIIYPGSLDPELDYRKDSQGYISPFSLAVSGRKKILSSVLFSLTED